MGRTKQERERLLAFVDNPVPAGGIGPRVAQFPGYLLCVDPARYRCSRLAGQLADEVIEYVTSTGLGSHADNYRQAVDRLCRYVDELLGPEADRSGLDDAGLLDALVAWESSLPEGYKDGSTRPALLAWAIRVLIVRRADHVKRHVAPELERFARGTVLIGMGETTERDEFTRQEKRALVRAAWLASRATRTRLDDGWARAATGRHPDKGSWCSVADLLWGLAQDQITPDDIRMHLPKARQWPEGLREFAAGAEPLHPQTAKLNLCRRLIAALYPTTLDLHAYRVLLMDATGHTSEEVTSFGEAQIEFLPKGVRLTMLKLRAAALRHRAFRDRPDRAGAPDQGDDGPDERVMLDMPRREASAVVRQLLEVTARARVHAPHVADTLFVRAVVQHDASLVFDRWNPDQVRHRFAQWVAGAGVEIKGDVHIGRLRKSTKVEKAIATGGRIGAVADDHTQETFARHYAQGTTLRILSGRTIATAQQHWFDKALGRAEGPTIVDGDIGRDRLQESGLSEQEADDIMNGQLDVGVSHCRDPRQSPVGKPGELCPVMPLGCLECGNAWILPSNLPQLLLFQAHLEGVRSRLAPQHFDRVWGQRWRNLRAVLESRTEAELAQAHEHIQSSQATLDLPLSAFAEFDA